VICGALMAAVDEPCTWMALAGFFSCYSS